MNSLGLQNTCPFPYNIVVGRKWNFYTHHISYPKITHKAVSNDPVPIKWLKGNQSSSWESSVNLGHHSGKESHGHQWEKRGVLRSQPFPGDVFMSVGGWGGIAREEEEKMES